MSTSIIDLIDSLLSTVVESNGSDLHIKSRRPAFVRVQGKLKTLDMEPFLPEHVDAFINETVPERFMNDWIDHHQVDYVYQPKNKEMGRFRVNAFKQRGLPSIVFRYVKNNPPSFDELNLDADHLKQLCNHRDGIILLSGPTGVGKSSTIAAMLNHINQTFQKHIITLEAPIEFNYEDKNCVFNQREVGIDTPSFSEGLRSILRQDPDIILIGEMRDEATFEVALNAAETGHLVFSTLHSSSVQAALERILDFFPENKHNGLCRQLSSSVRAVIGQQLITSSDGSCRYPVMEILVIESLARKTILEGQFTKIESVIEATRESGSHSLNQDLIKLIQANKVTREDAMHLSPNAEALEMNLSGVHLSSGGIVQ